MTDKLLGLITNQIALQFKAHSIALAHREATKDAGFEGTHKWLGRWQDDQMKIVTGLMKFMLSYVDKDTSVPMVVACPCEFVSLMETFKAIDTCVREAQEGFRMLTEMADAEGQMDVESFGDKYLHEGIGEIKKMTRFLNKLRWIGDDRAALMAFDKARM